MADINNTKQLNYSAEDINTMLSTLANLENTVKGWIQEALKEYKSTLTKQSITQIINSETFRNNYSPIGNYTIEGNTISVTYTISETTGKDMMNDLARFLGSLYESGISTITYKDKKYTWDPDKGLKGSNFVDESGTTLISTVVSEFGEITEGVSSSFIADGIELIYQVNIES